MMNKITAFQNLLIAFTIAFTGCQPVNENQQASLEEETTLKAGVVVSLMGDELPVKVIPDKTRAEYEKKLAKAKESFDANSDSLNAIIWYGRRLAYLGKYDEAINVYSDGLAKYPNSYRLRRHRGHRHITTRQLDKALKDFELAAFHSTGVQNQIEPDGIPNRLNKPLGNDKFNIWYHFGLANYLNGRFDKAVSTYKKCLEYCDNDDLKVATSYWLYMSAKRIGNVDLASELLDAISPNMKMIENEAYLDLLLLFKEVKKPEELIKKATNSDGNLNPTLAYGIGMNYLLNNQVDDARNILWKILESPSWDAFGYIAAEADIKNMATSVD